MRPTLPGSSSRLLQQPAQCSIFADITIAQEHLLQQGPRSALSMLSETTPIKIDSNQGGPGLGTWDAGTLREIGFWPRGNSKACSVLVLWLRSLPQLRFASPRRFIRAETSTASHRKARLQESTPHSTFPSAPALTEYPRRIVRKGCSQKLSPYEHPHSANRLRPTASGQIQGARYVRQEINRPREVAHNLGVSVPTLYRWVSASSRM